MFELGDILESQPATSAFVIGSIILMLINVSIGTGLVLIRDMDHPWSLRRATKLKIAATLAGASVFLLVGVGVGASSIMSHRKAAAIAAPATTISIDEIHRQIDMKALPVQEVSDFM